jgi:protein-tyrosine phosphatase
MTDYHCHILPGLDDGPSTLDESVRMARMLSKAGFTSVYCTPHLIKNVYEASNAVVRESLTKLQTEIDRHGITLRLREGREYFTDRNFHEYLDDLMPLEGTRYLLIEIPPGTNQAVIIETLGSILRKGFIPMIAHPERSSIWTEHQNTKSKSQGFLKRNNIIGRMERECSYRYIELFDWLLCIECAFQCNLSSLSGNSDRSIHSVAKHLCNQKTYTHYGTDAHSIDDVEKIVSSIHKVLRALSYVTG